MCGRIKLDKTVEELIEHFNLVLDKDAEQFAPNSNISPGQDAYIVTSAEPDVIGYDKKTDEYIFCDCSPESPKGRRSLCYDGRALEERKEAKPAGSAVDMAADMGIALLTEEDYRRLQELGEFDLKTSSWLETPADIRKLGGSIFGDRRYDHIFIYHNGAESYYAARGFRGLLRV
ncbi:MAG TPA: DUF4256 domain-containing protein [Ignavibacteriales bacterium]|nr:DUF4256 domain-containing protein [Ignavibacteriales bacterium]